MAERNLILLGVSGGVSAYKAAALTSKLVQAGRDVQVILTPAAEKFVGEATFAALSGRPVAKGVFDPDRYPLGAHIELARSAKALVVAPATADFLAKAAHGLADDLLSTTYLCFDGPILFAPAMNVEMWRKPVVQRNVEALKRDGVAFVGPEEGWLSCRDRGAGRMSEPEAIFAAIEATLSEGS